MGCPAWASHRLTVSSERSLVNVWSRYSGHSAACTATLIASPATSVPTLRFNDKKVMYQPSIADNPRLARGVVQEKNGEPLFISVASDSSWRQQSGHPLTHERHHLRLEPRVRSEERRVGKESRGRGRGGG